VILSSISAQVVAEAIMSAVNATAPALNELSKFEFILGSDLNEAFGSRLNASAADASIVTTRGESALFQSFSPE